MEDGMEVELLPVLCIRYSTAASPEYSGLRRSDHVTVVQSMPNSRLMVSQVARMTEAQGVVASSMA